MSTHAMCLRMGRGRQALALMRFANTVGQAVFMAFMTVPFLYELRQVLDWCAAGPSALTVLLFAQTHSRDMHKVSCNVNRRAGRFMWLGAGDDSHYRVEREGVWSSAALFHAHQAPVLVFLGMRHESATLHRLHASWPGFTVVA